MGTALFTRAEASLSTTKAEPCIVSRSEYEDAYAYPRRRIRHRFAHRSYASILEGVALSKLEGFNGIMFHEGEWKLHVNSGVETPP